MTPLSGLVKAGARYLVQEGNFATGTQLPTPDAQGAIGMAAGAGVVALVSNTTSYPTFGSGTTPADLAGVTANGLVDVVGYGTTAITYETAATGVNLTSTTSAATGRRRHRPQRQRLRRAGAHSRGVWGGLRRPGDPAG